MYFSPKLKLYTGCLQGRVVCQISIMEVENGNINVEQDGKWKNSSSCTISVCKIPSYRCTANKF